MSDRIEELRAEIDALDEAITAAVARRRAIVSELAEEKARRGASFLDPAREARIEERYGRALSMMREAEARALARAVLEACRPGANAK